MSIWIFHPSDSKKYCFRINVLLFLGIPVYFKSKLIKKAFVSVVSV